MSGAGKKLADVANKTFKVGKRLPHTFENDICTVCGSPKRFERDGDFLYFGSFPQSLKAEGVTVAKNASVGGYYLGSDGEFYAKVIATPRLSSYCFANGERIIENEIYYFKVEPIKWRIVAEEDDRVLLHCENILTSMPFDDGGNNNYKTSSLRSWLNNKFLSMSFKSFEREIIEITDLGNTTEEIKDKAFIFSIEDQKNYSVTVSGKRLTGMRFVTDYSRALGGEYGSYPIELAGLHNWWTRTPEGNKCALGGSNYPAPQEPDFPHRGVVPAMWVELR